MKYRCIVLFLFTAIFIPSVASGQTDLRAWNADGQTWIVWKNALVPPLTYDIHVSREPIDDLANATLAGRTFPIEATAERLKIAKLDARWVLPDGHGGRYTLSEDEGVFVYTPHEAVPEYFAVVKHNETGVGPQNTAGPVEQNLDPVQCHEQFDGVNAAGAPFTVYAHWADGREDPEDGRPDYPVMANRFANGVGHVFAVFDPVDGRTGVPMPAVIALHGAGYGSYMNYGSGLVAFLGVDPRIPDGFLIGLDDVLPVLEARSSVIDVYPEQTRWFGYWSEFDRFELPAGPPPDDAVIVNYTLRRVDFILDWLLAHEDIDPGRLSLTGISGGGGGVSFLARWEPWRFSAGTSLVAPFTGTPLEGATYLLGKPDQNLATNLPGGIGLRDFYWPTTMLWDDDAPFLNWLLAKNDETGDWPLRVEAFQEMDDLQLGWHLLWDGRMHISRWLGQHWTVSERLNPRSLTRYRNDQSFPVFGRPEGEASACFSDTENEWGTWAGYFDWDPETVLDTPDAWEATIALVGESPTPNDVPNVDSCSSDLSIRRAQSFMPQSGAKVTWTVTEDRSGKTSQEGTLTVSSAGRFIVPRVIVRKTPARLRLAFVSPDDDSADDDSSDDTADNDSTVPGEDDDDGDHEGCGC